MRSPQAVSTFDPLRLASQPEPVRRYLEHAIAPGTPLTPGVSLSMSGRIRVRYWLSFTATQECDGRSFAWSARARVGPVALLDVVDQYSSGEASMDVRLRPGLRLLHADDSDTVRSAAGRAAGEGVFAPIGLLPRSGVTWRAIDDEHIVATCLLAPLSAPSADSVPSRRRCCPRIVGTWRFRKSRSTRCCPAWVVGWKRCSG